MEHDHEYSVLIPFTGELMFGVKAKKGLTNKEVRTLINADFSILGNSTAMFSPTDFIENWEDYYEIALIKDEDGNVLPFIADDAEEDLLKKRDIQKDKEVEE